MKIVAELHGYPPFHNSGAEWMVHHVFRYLVQNGIEVCVLLDFNSYLGKVSGEYENEGVKVVSDKDWRKHYFEADFVVTHLDKTGKAYNRAREFKKPLIHFIHNHYKNVVIEQMNAVDQYAIYNTKWVQDECKPKQKQVKKSIVVHPPVFIDDYKVNRINDYATLINVNKNKGGELLIALAKKIPEQKFMGVKGSYGHQIFDHKVKNIHYLENTPNIKDVYKRTKILLMPSSYESYGRTAIEAGASGIPVVCTPTIGLREALGDAGIYCDRNNLKEWVDAIAKLRNEKNYKRASSKIKKHVQKLKPVEDLKRLLNFIKYEIYSK